MDTRICDAIENRRILEFRYDGLPRVVQPHTHGTSTKGKETLRAYQIDGRSNSGPLPDWRPFTVSKINGLNATNNNFTGTAPDYDPNDDMMKRVHCHL
jgi:hypothetical protein